MPSPRFGLLLIGDEILSGRRQDAHLPYVIGLLASRGLALSWAKLIGDDPPHIVAALREAFASGDIVFSCGGIGSTPDDHTRQCAAQALGVPLAAHPEATQLLLERMRRRAAEQGQPFEPERPDNAVRLQMAVFPEGARIIPNPYNQVAGFSVGDVHFMPGFPEMAHPMMAGLMAGRYAHIAPRDWAEHALHLQGAFEAELTALMRALEAQFPTVQVFSLPRAAASPAGYTLELGVKGPSEAAGAAFTAMQHHLRARGLAFGAGTVAPATASS